MGFTEKNSVLIKVIWLKYKLCNFFFTSINPSMLGEGGSLVAFCVSTYVPAGYQLAVWGLKYSRSDEST